MYQINRYSRKVDVEIIKKLSTYIIYLYIRTFGRLSSHPPFYVSTFLHLLVKCRKFGDIVESCVERRFL